jgi:hypothetical protein
VFASPLGLLALFAVPAVLALHLYRRRFEPREVSALFLWASQDRAPVAGRKREPLKHNASLWLELLCAALLAVAFSGPRAACAGARGEHLVVVLDSSASMSALAGGEGLRERAVERLRERIEALPRGSRVTLVESGRRPRILAGPAAFPTQASEALDAWKPLAGRHDLATAASLALQFAGDARLVVVTDHFAPEAWPATTELIALGEPLDNWALTHAARTSELDEQGAESERVFVTVASFAASDKAVTLAVAGERGELARQTRTLGPGARAHFAVRVPEGSGPLEVRLADDALAIDNFAYLAPGPRRRLALHSTLAGEQLAALGLSRGESEPLARWLDLVPRSVAVDSVASAHLVLGDLPGDLSGAESAAWSLEFAPLGAERRDWLGPFLLDRTNALLDGLTLEGAVWSADPELELAGAPLISIGALPLLTEERRGARTIWRFNFDPLRSSLQRTPDWPILLSNLAEARRAALPGPERTNLALGQRFVHRPAEEAAGLDRTQALVYSIEGPFEGVFPDAVRAASESKQGVPARELAVREQLEFDDFAAPGWHRLRFGEREVARLGVSFLDGAESDLRNAGSGRRDALVAAGSIDEEFSWLEFAALAGALLAVGLDWWVLSSARQVRARQA